MNKINIRLGVELDSRLRFNFNINLLLQNGHAAFYTKLKPSIQQETMLYMDVFEDAMQSRHWLQKMFECYEHVIHFLF